MEIFTEIYSFRLNVINDNLSSSFCVEQIEFITKICLLDWACRLIELENINSPLVSMLLHLAA